MINSFSELFHKHFLSFLFKVLSVMFSIIKVSSFWLSWLSSFTIFFLFLFFFFNWNKFCSILKIVLIVGENVTNFTVNIGEDDLFSFIFKFKKESIGLVDHLIHNSWGFDSNRSNKLTCKFS